MKTSTVTVKGQIVIPAWLRKKYGIQTGALMHFYYQEGEIRMIPLTHETIDLNVGFLKTQGKLQRALASEKKVERVR
jgi:AbrB family looped-hinge helix DNA binding protein